MSRTNHRVRYNRKTRIAKRIMRDETLDPETKRLALQVLKLADRHGVIYNDALYAVAQEMNAEAAKGGPHGRQ